MKTVRRYAKRPDDAKKRPVVYLYDVDDDLENVTIKKNAKKELLWGDWLRIGKDINSRWSEVKWGK